MRAILFILSALAFFLGIGIISSATAIFQEIAGFLLFLITAVFFVGAVIVNALYNVRTDTSNELTKIIKLLESSNLPANKLASSPNVSVPDSEETFSEDELMVRYKITHDGKKYCWGDYHYDKFEDALAYARSQNKNNS